MNKRLTEGLTAAALSALLAGGAFLADRVRPGDAAPMPAPRVVREAEVIDFKIAETPAPTPTPNILPPTAHDIYVNDEKVLFTLSSETTAKALLNGYLKDRAGAIPENEHLISAEYAVRIRIIPTRGELPLSTAAEALEQLRNDPQLLPVKVVTERSEYITNTHRKETAEDDALPVGSRIYRSWGKDGLTAIRSTVTYEGGEEIAATTGTLELIWESNPESVREGIYWSEEPDKPAGKKEGPEGKELGYKLQLPVRVSIGKYFGVNENVFHRGIDLFAKRGTEVKTPGEGVVVWVGERGDYGMTVDIDHGNGFVSRLTHLSPDTLQVVLNQRIFKDELVGFLAPNEENPNVKPHVHYELLIDGEPFNPLYYIG
ncbi:MAG: M23 family metallopeptidase [Clostridia bacterium]|nr:M23 family metallopeptidase [Clostridia bacterium]